MNGPNASHQERLTENAIFAARQIDLREVADRLLGEGKKIGHARQYASPFRDDGSKKSFVVYEDGYKDFGGDGRSGDAINFVMQLMQCSFVEAVKYLAGTEIQPVIPRPKITPTLHRETPTTEWQQAMKAFILDAQKKLWANPLVLDYLHNQRGLNDQTIDKYRLGYNPEWIFSGIEDQHGQIFIAPGIVIPWCDEDTIQAIRIRCHIGDLATHLGIKPDSHLSKYLSVRGSKLASGFFGLSGSVSGCDVLIVEGEFDAMLAAQESRFLAITRGSASSYHNMPEKWLKRLSEAKKIYSLMDSDAAGKQAHEALNETLANNVIQLRLPQGKDITDYLIHYQGKFEDLTINVPIQQIKPWWPDGMPDGWRSYMLNFFPGSTTPLLHLLNDAIVSGRLNTSAFDINQVVEITGLARRTVQEVMQILENVFWQKIDIPDSDEDIYPVSAIRCGRKGQLYRILSIDTARKGVEYLAWFRIFERLHEDIVARPDPHMAQQIGVDSTTMDAWIKALEPIFELQDQAQRRATERANILIQRWTSNLDRKRVTPLPEGFPVNSASSYRAAFLRGLVETEGELPRTRRMLCDLLGLSNSSLDAIYKKAGLKAEIQEQDVPLNVAIPLEHSIQQVSREFRGHPMGLIAVGSDGKTCTYDHRSSDASDFVDYCKRKNHKVYLRIRTPSIHRITDAESITKEPSRKKRILSRLPVKEKQDQIRKEKWPSYFGPGYNPAWLLDQLIQALHQLTIYRICDGRTLLDSTTGEILLRNTPPRLILELLLVGSIENLELRSIHRRQS